MKNEIIAVDLGGTRMRVGLVKGTRIIKYVNKPTPKTSKEIIHELSNNISKFMSKRVKAIGVSSAGVIENGVVKRSPNLPLNNINIKKVLSKKFKTKVVVENDANCVAIAESRIGVRKKNIIILTLGTGIGGGIIIDGKLQMGRGMGGELGHIILNQGKDFEYWASSKAVKRLTKRELKREFSIKELLDNKSKKADKIKEEIASYIGQGIASLANIFDPEVIVLAGGMRILGNPFLNKIKKYTKKYLFIPRKLDIRWSRLRYPGIQGASLLIS